MIYFDNASTTKPFQEVVDIFNKYNLDSFANASSIHKLGIQSSSLINKAKCSIFKSLKLDSKYEIIFTSSATEANNLAIKGYCLKNRGKGNHIITTNIEHPSILECFYYLKNEFNFDIDIINVDKDGRLQVEDIIKHIKTNTIFVSVMGINNEIGSIFNIEEFNKEIHKFPKVTFFSDLTQCIGKHKLNYSSLDMFSFSSHKIHGLNGCGALIYKKDINLLPIIHGGNQQNGIRSGTIPHVLALSMAKAVQLTMQNENNSIKHVSNLKSRLLELLENNEDIEFNSNAFCSPFIVNFSLIRHKASVVVEALSNYEIFVSSVSACHSALNAHSHVIKALGKNDNISNNSIRISFSYDNTIEEVEEFCSKLNKILKDIKI